MVEIRITLPESLKTISKENISVEVVTVGGKKKDSEKKCGCYMHEGIDINVLGVGDRIMVIKTPPCGYDAFIGKGGEIEGFSVSKFGTYLHLGGYRGYIKGCTIQKFCPKCGRVVNEFNF